MKLASVHIPKTGGLSFRKHLRHLFGKRVIWDYNHTDRPDYKPEKVSPFILAQLRSNKTAVIHGHFFLSKYHNIPGLQRAVWFREPVQRLLSHYYYWLRGPDMDHPNCRALHEGGLSAVEFAKLPELRNVFTRFLDGTPVNELNWVGLVEDYQASIDLFYAMYAVGRDPREIAPHENKNPGRRDKRAYDLNEDDMQQIRELNGEDRLLYYLAQKKFKGLVKRYGDGY